MVSPPVDFSTLGQMAVLGDFDALTPVMASGQQNTFDKDTFSILELTRVSVVKSDSQSASTTSNEQYNKYLQGDNGTLVVPILLASFTVDTHESGPQSVTDLGITATCVLDRAPHQVYIGGYFKQAPSTPSIVSNSSTAPITSSPRTGLNYVGLYDSKLKQFLPMGNGLDGPVQDILCDSETDQVYVVGQFRGPLQDELMSDENSSNSSSYQAMGLFGGGVAMWKRELDQEQQENTPSAAVAASQDKKASSGNYYGYKNMMQAPKKFAQASGSWVAMPFKGVNGVVTSVAKGTDGTIFFGGAFDTTTDAELFSAPDTQPVNMDNALVFTGNGADPAQDRNIICRSASRTGVSSRSNWILRDNMTGYWRIEFPLYITPTLFRLWNVDMSSAVESDDRLEVTGANYGTKSFSIMAQPSNQLLNLSFIDPLTHLVQYCTVCTLLPRTISTSVHQGYQDFLVMDSTLLQAVQIDVLSWYGRGGGLGGIEIYQEEIFVHAVDELNSPVKCSLSATSLLTAPPETTAVGAVSSLIEDPEQGAKSGTSSRRKSKSMVATSNFLGADWASIRMTDGWQAVLAASVTATDESTRKQAYVDLSPYLQESGMYDVYLYTPGCDGNKETKNDSSGHSTTSPPSNACPDRGFVDVNMYFVSAENVQTITLSQLTKVDRYDKIYSGMIVHSTQDFGPHVVVGPSISRLGTAGGGKHEKQTVIVDSIQFVKQATLNDTNSLLFYRPGNITASPSSVSTTQDTKDGHPAVSRKAIQGLDGSTWGNLLTQLPSGAVVNSLVSYYGPTQSSANAEASTLLFIGGSFQGVGYGNIVAWDGTLFVTLSSKVSASPVSGLDDSVSAMALYETALYVVGTFQQSLDPATVSISSGDASGLPGGLAIYDILMQSWRSFGNVTEHFQPDSVFTSIKLSMSMDGQPQLVIGGRFEWLKVAIPSTNSLAVWDINREQWIQEGLPCANSTTQQQGEGFPFGYLHGHISYLHRVLGSTTNSTNIGDGGLSSATAPVVLVAGKIASLDTYQVSQPENMAWLSDSGSLKTFNLSPAISTSAPPSYSLASGFSTAAPNIANTAGQDMLAKTGAGIMYFNRETQQWVTIVGGAHADGSIGAGYFNSPALSSSADTMQEHMLTYKRLDMSGADPLGSMIAGEVLALGIVKDEATGDRSTKSGNELLLIGGAFKSTSKSVDGLAMYDLVQGLVVSSSLVPAMKGMKGRDPVIQVIKSHPGMKGTLVLAGEFSGVGDSVLCELVCVWDAKEARKLLDKKKSIEGSFKSVYGSYDSSGRKHVGVIQGVVNDIAFEDDNNMYVAGELIVNGVACGVASFNFENSKWTTFGSMIDTAPGSGATAHPPGPDALIGPVTAIAHDSTFHRFFEFDRWLRILQEVGWRKIHSRFTRLYASERNPQA
ncbi:hypothetical protein EDD11_001361 [Mortierella claussenii]|nr:hypothetical protein EDD11_001361 [Mortierella claussenii]